MTDGIIQKTFNKYYSYAMYMTERGYIESIEQELISDIKKELKQIEYRDDDGLWSYPGEIQNERNKISIWLIGDNKK